MLSSRKEHIRVTIYPISHRMANLSRLPDFKEYSNEVRIIILYI